MLLGRSSTRNPRGTQNRSSRGARGQGSTSRGASSSSSKFKNEIPIPGAPRAMRNTSNAYQSRYRGKIFKDNYSSFKHTGTSSGPSSPNPFERERLENAAKRTQRGQNGTMVNGRGGRGTQGGPYTNKQVRFADTSTEQKLEPFSKAPSPSTTNPFLANSTSQSSPFGSPVPAPFNPFAGTPKSDASVNPFGSPSAMPNPFGAPSQHPPTASSMFGTPSVPESANSWQKSPAGIFGAPPTSTSNPFAVPVPKANGGLDTAPTSSMQSNSSQFGAPSASTFPNSNSAPANVFASPAGSIPSTFASSPTSIFTSNPNGASNKLLSNSKSLKSSPFSPAKAPSEPTAPQTSQPEPDSLAARIDRLLRKERIIPPQWPAFDPGQDRPLFNDPIMGKFISDFRDYRTKVRASLIRAGYIDDPEKPKKLSEAIDFKGTCEDMCPEFEKISRLMDRMFDSAEKEVYPDGSLSRYAVPHKMVKALARSAAGQDAPLPSDIRSAAALRRTFDYLINDVLGEKELPKVHGFLWDRTRAIRRDFVFHSSMSPPELIDQVYCLERIARFHVTSLHQMSKREVISEGFVEQQEVEQLGKALLSLIHAYEDCNAQGVVCENEAEFRAYWILNQSRDTGILETVQNWGWKFWGESSEIMIAISLVEAFQNTWEIRGPLKPLSTTDIAQNAFSRFFSIVEDKSVSYTMACFAEMYFNDIRKAILKTILSSYRKQRDQTKDWTIAKLNTYLRFDDEEDIIPFGEAYGLRFDEINGENYLSFEGDEIRDAFPKQPQSHSYALVERKRGNHSLPEVINTTVFEDAETETESHNEDDEGLFVKDILNTTPPLPKPVTAPEALQPAMSNSQSLNLIPTPAEAKVQMPPGVQNTPKPTSIFDRIAAPKAFDSSFTAMNQTANSTTVHPSIIDPKPTSIFTTPVNASSSIFKQSPLPKDTPLSHPPPIFSFPQQVTAQRSNEHPSAPASTESKGFAISPAPTENPKAPFSFDQQPTATPQPTITDTPAEPIVKPIPSSTQQTPLPTFFSPPAVASPFHRASMTSISQPPTGTPTKASVGLLLEQGTAVQKPLPSAQSSNLVDRVSRYSGLANWVALGNDGIIDQFTAFQVESILRETVRKFVEEEQERAAKEADALAKIEADRFRYRSLATKYGHFWREEAHRLWQKRRGREARQARRELAESMRASKAARAANIVEDFKASTARRRRDSLESMLGATGIANGVHDTNDEIRAIVQQDPKPATKRQRSDRSTSSVTSSTSKHKRGRSDNPLRRSLLSDPSYLSGGSRIHLMSNYDTQDEHRPQASGVQTDYFRLKARGISTLPDGTPLAHAAAKNILHQKRSFDGISKGSTPQQSKVQSMARSISANPPHLECQDSGDHDDEIEALKAKAKAIVSEDKQSRQTRRFVDDEELFERAKRIREQMDEGAKWFRKEIERVTPSRSRS